MILKALVGAITLIILQKNFDDQEPDQNRQVSTYYYYSYYCIYFIFIIIDILKYSNLFRFDSFFHIYNKIQSLQLRRREQSSSILLHIRHPSTNMHNSSNNSRRFRYPKHNILGHKNNILPNPHNPIPNRR